MEQKRIYAFVCKFHHAVRKQPDNMFFTWLLSAHRKGQEVRYDTLTYTPFFNLTPPPEPLPTPTVWGLVFQFTVRELGLQT